MNKTELNKLSSQELVALYNSKNAEKPIKRFTNRDTAIKRCMLLFAAPNKPTTKILGVLVNGEEFRSLDAAFKKLGWSKSIQPVRARLRTEKKIEFNGVTFEAI